MNRRPATINVPLAWIGRITRKPRSGFLMWEVKIDQLRRVNEPEDLDALISEARFEHALGKTKTFRTAHDLIADLRR